MRKITFRIPQSMYLNSPEKVKLIMGKCLIHRCEFLAMWGCYEFHAESDEFKEGFNAYEWSKEGESICS